LHGAALEFRNAGRLHRELLHLQPAEHAFVAFHVDSAAQIA